MTAPAPIVGRRAELETLERLLGDVLAGKRAAVALVGEPGIGKTRVLRELTGRAHAMGFNVLAGRAFELERDIPFGLVAGTLDEPLSGLAPAALERLGDERVAELAAVLPSLAGVGGGLTTTLETERYRSHHAVRTALEELASEQPLALVFDDVHWGDPASLEVVSHLLRHGVSGSLMALAYRPHQAPRMLVDVVARQATETELHVLELGPLSQRDATKLMADARSPAELHALYAESGGNPFYLEQLARAAEGGTPPIVVGDPSRSQRGVPPAVRETIASELDALSASGRELLQAAAVAGEPFDLDLAAEVAALDEPAAFAALDELARAELLRETDVPGQLVFRHPIVRRAVYDTTGSGWLLAAHRRAAVALDGRGAAMGTRAYHVERSAKVGDRDAIDLLTRAGHAAAARAPAAAARWLEAALRLLPETTDPAQRLALLLPLATALGNLGRLQDSQAMLVRALALVPESDVATRSTLTAGIARTEQGLGRGSEARRLLLAALAATDPGSAEAIRLTIELAINHLLLLEWDSAVSAAATARTRAKAFGAPTLIAAAAAASALIEAFGGGAGLTRSRKLTDEATAALDQLADDELDSVTFEALANTANAEATLNAWETASRHAERGIRIGRMLGHGALLVDFMNVRAAAQMLLGNLGEARQAADSAVEGAMLVDNDQRLAAAQGIRCLTAWAQGQHDDALAAGKHGIEAAERAPSSLMAWLPHLAYGQVLVSAGEHEHGRAEILASGGYELTDLPPNFHTYWYRALAELEATSGRLDVADEMAGRAEEMAKTMSLPMRTADARYARACVHRGRGDLALAAEFALDAAAHYDADDTLLEATKARLLAGGVLADAGDVAAAQRELERAYAASERMGAAGLAQRAGDELRRLGAPVKRHRRRRDPLASGPQALTAREREVADLVAQGHTNREIAEQLFVSPKTVETHLSQVFTKLHVSSRVAVAGAMRAGAAPG